MRNAFLPFALPSIGEDEINEVVDSLRSGWVTTGPKVGRFEADVASYIGCKHAIAVNSCTAALHIALTALDVGPGDEVIVPTLTFCATANIVVHLGARPVLVDVGPDLNVTAAAVETAITSRTKAIIPVHHSGQPCDMEALNEISVRTGVPLVEDAAHAIGAEFKGRRIGTIAPITAFSFYAIKNMTTGEGGLIATDDDRLAARMRMLALHGMNRDAWKRYTSAGSWFYEIVEAGYKQNMTDIQASLGIHQLKRLDGFIATRQRYAAVYDEAFGGMPGIECPIVNPDRLHARHLYVITLARHGSLSRDAFIQALRERQVGTSVHFIPVHLHPFYRDRFGCRPGDCPVAEDIYERMVSLPLYPAMTSVDVNDVIEAVRDVLQ